MLLSVCIVNWNTCAYLRECLAALGAFPPQGAQTEVIVVDNASTDGSAQMVREQFPAAQLIAHDANVGYARGNNDALKRVSGQAVLLLNPDAVVQEHALTNALRALEAHPRAGAVGARLLNPDGTTQASLRSFPDPLPVLWEYVGLSRLFPRSRVFGRYRMTYWNYNAAGLADQPMGTFLLIRRAALDDVGVLDEQFPIFFNEVDWCWRASREKGWEIRYEPSARVTHYGGASTSQARPAMREESHRALLRFYEKHYRVHLPRVVYALMTLAVRLNARRVTGRALHRETA